MDAANRELVRLAVDDCARVREEQPRRRDFGVLDRDAYYEREVTYVVPSKGGEVQELIGHIRKAGYKVVRSGSQKHYKVQTSKGVVVTDDNGPLIISTSPSDHRWREMHVQRLMRAGVLKEDPYKATGKQSRGPKGNGANGSSAEDGEKALTPAERKKLAEREAQTRVARSRSGSAVEGTAKLRARFEPVVPHLGGWAQGAGPRAHLSLTDLRVLTVSELAAVMHHWAQSRGRMELPRDKITKQLASPKEVEAAARGLKSGSTISERWQPLTSVFLDDIWRDAENDPRKAAARYLNLLREQKGIIEPPESPRAGGPGPLIPLAPDRPGRAESEPAKVGPAYEPKVPALALEARYLMSGAADQERAAEVATRIAELEFRYQQEEGK